MPNKPFALTAATLAALTLSTAIGISACGKEESKSEKQSGSADPQLMQPKPQREWAANADRLRDTGPAAGESPKLEPLTKPSPASPPPTDQRITAEVIVTIDKNVADANDVDVDTKNGVVTLNGSVPTEAARNRIIELVLTIAGVRAVQADQLIVKPA